jgi:hypothetical protein
MTDVGERARELLACPMIAVGWCPGGEIVAYEGDSRSPAFVRCSTCRTIRTGRDLDGAHEAWNTRTTLPARTYADGVEDAAKVADDAADRVAGRIVYAHQFADRARVDAARGIAAAIRTLGTNNG